MKHQRICRALGLSRRRLLLGAAGMAASSAFLGGCHHASPPKVPSGLRSRIDEVRARTVGLLESRQSDDGAFRSREVSELRSGYALTPLVLLGLEAGGAGSHQSFSSGLEFCSRLATKLDAADGAHEDGIVYPVAAAALTLQLLCRAPNAQFASERNALSRYLCAAQFGEGFEDKTEFGGFGYVPAKVGSSPTDPELSTPNISATLLVSEALAAQQGNESQAALERATAFVERCQNYSDGDGGFCFAPAQASLNKAGPDPKARTGFRSYGTATANGVRLLRLLGKPATDLRLSASAKWLSTHFDPERTSGKFPKERLEDARSIYFYYVWTSAVALDALGSRTIETSRGPQNWADALGEAVLARELPGGGFVNPVAKRGEKFDVAAPLILVALNRISRNLSDVG